MSHIRGWWHCLTWSRNRETWTAQDRQRWSSYCHDQIVNLTLKQYGGMPRLGVLLVLSGSVQ